MIDKLYKREPMTNDERKVFEANKHLVKRKNELERDVRVLVSYLKGRKYLENEVKEIISYYSPNRKENNES